MGRSLFDIALNKQNLVRAHIVAMFCLGIDPGLRNLGCVLLERNGNDWTLHWSRTVDVSAATTKDSMPKIALALWEMKLPEDGVYDLAIETQAPFGGRNTPMRIVQYAIQEHFETRRLMSARAFAFRGSVYYVAPRDKYRATPTGGIRALDSGPPGGKKLSYRRRKRETFDTLQSMWGSVVGGGEGSHPMDSHTADAFMCAAYVLCVKVAGSVGQNQDVSV